MLKVEELEYVLVNAMNSAIEQGYLLVCNDWGVRWDEATNRWVADSAGSPVMCCDVFGAVLLGQPPLDPKVHMGDPDRAARMIVDPDFYTTSPDIETLLDSAVYEVCRNVCNGWDSEEFLGGDETTYRLGQRLADIYQPLSADVFALTGYQPVSQLSLDAFPDDDEDGSYEGHQSGIHVVASPSEELVGLIEIESAVG